MKWVDSINFLKSNKPRKLNEYKPFGDIRKLKIPSPEEFVMGHAYPNTHQVSMKVNEIIDALNKITYKY